MGCGVCCLKCLVIFVNVIVGIVGAALLAAGAFIMASFNKTLKPYLDDAMNSIPGIPDSFSLEDAIPPPQEGIDLDISAILKSVAIVLIVIGVFLLLIAIIGSFGACCSNRIMLIVYAVIVLTLFLVQTILVILFFTGALDATMKKQMKKTITENYVGIDDYGLWSLAWNVMMAKFKCCGVEDYQDFEAAKKWKKQREVSAYGTTVTIELKIPMACCKFKDDFPNSVEPINELCATQPSDLWCNWKAGCWTQLWEELSNIMGIMKGAIAGVLVFQLLCAIAAIIIAVYIQKEKGEVA